MKILNHLSESKMFRSKSAIERITARQAADLFHMHICALLILRESPQTAQWSKDYARRTLHSGSFTEWRSNSTDLGILGWSLISDDVDFRLASTSSRLKERLTIDEANMIRWLKSINSGSIDMGLTKKIFSRIDLACRIEDESLRAIRRLSQDWSDLDTEEASLTITRLLQLFRAHGPQSELLPELEKLAQAHGLELKNVCNPETGEGCGNKHHAQDEPPPEKKKGNLFAKMASVAAGAAVGYHLTRGRHVKEDATAGATCAGDVAAFAQPMGMVQRRAMPATIAIPSNTTRRTKNKKKPK